MGPCLSLPPAFPGREFARWKVRNTAIERRDLIRNPVPLMPEFQRSVRMLGRRPSTQQFIDTIIKKYGTHILISATLGGKMVLISELLHQCTFKEINLGSLGRRSPSLRASFSKLRMHKETMVMRVLNFLHIVLYLSNKI